MLLETQFDYCKKDSVSVGSLCFSLVWFRDFFGGFFNISHVAAVLAIPGEEVTK